MSKLEHAGASSTTPSGAAISINGQLGAILFGIIAIAAGAALLAGVAKKWQTTLLGVGIVAFVLSFLCWQVAGKFMPLVDTASGTLQVALPLILVDAHCFPLISAAVCHNHARVSRFAA